MWAQFYSVCIVRWQWNYLQGNKEQHQQVHFEDVSLECEFRVWVFVRMWVWSLCQQIHFEDVSLECEFRVWVLVRMSVWSLCPLLSTPDSSNIIFQAVVGVSYFKQSWVCHISSCRVSPRPLTYALVAAICHIAKVFRFSLNSWRISLLGADICHMPLQPMCSAFFLNSWRMPHRSLSSLFRPKQKGCDTEGRAT